MCTYPTITILIVETPSQLEEVWNILNTSSPMVHTAVSAISTGVWGMSMKKKKNRIEINFKDLSGVTIVSWLHWNNNTITQIGLTNNSPRGDQKSDAASFTTEQMGQFLAGVTAFFFFLIRNMKFFILWKTASCFSHADRKSKPWNSPHCFKKCSLAGRHQDFVGDYQSLHNHGDWNFQLAATKTLFIE